MKEIKHRKTGVTIRWRATYDELYPEQRHSIWHGDACGHPSNRPKDEAQARRWLWELSPDAQTITGMVLTDVDIMSGRAA